jgi:hypothetical protein
MDPRGRRAQSDIWDALVAFQRDPTKSTVSIPTHSLQPFNGSIICSSPSL